jgi:RNA polymerase sigma-70 factor (ECF subfamily)
MMSRVGVAVGDEPVEAFRLLCRPAIAAVYSFVLPRCGGNVAVAQDVTSETLLAGAVAARSGQSVSIPWLRAVARNKLVDHWRRGEREDRRLQLAWADTTESEEPLEWEGSDWRTRALAVMADLPPSHQAALALRYLDDRSVADVADALGKSVHATESLLARARREFRATFREHDHD